MGCNCAPYQICKLKKKKRKKKKKEEEEEEEKKIYPTQHNLPSLKRKR